jgi:peptidoglycan biosynthesis protein MviN/MurJ (putative lipid II flippase)
MVGALNVHGKFFAGAFSPIILNLSMIGILAFCYFVFHGERLELATCTLLCSFGWRGVPNDLAVVSVKSY